MSDIALYTTLRKIDGVTDGEAKEVIADIAGLKDVTTKSDLVRIEKIIAELETRLTRQMYAVAGIVIAAVGVIVKIL